MSLHAHVICLCAHFCELCTDSVADGGCIYSRPGIPSLPCVQTLGVVYVVYQSRKGSVLCALVLMFRTPLSGTVGVTHAGVRV